MTEQMLPKEDLRKVTAHRRRGSLSFRERPAETSVRALTPSEWQDLEAWRARACEKQQ
jgi:hypothetical protein